MAFAIPSRMPSAKIFGFVTKLSSPTSCSFLPSAAVSDGQSRSIWTEVATHSPNRLRHDRNRRQFESVQPTGVLQTAERGHAVSKCDHQRG